MATKIKTPLTITRAERLEAMENRIERLEERVDRCEELVAEITRLVRGEPARLPLAIVEGGEDA